MLNNRLPKKIRGYQIATSNERQVTHLINTTSLVRYETINTCFTYKKKSNKDF